MSEFPFFYFIIIFFKQTIVGCRVFFSTNQNPGFHPGKITFSRPKK